MKKATVSAPIMNENRNFHHFLNMSRNIHDVINAMDVRSIEISQAIAVQDDGVMAMENIAAAKSTGNSHQNLLMKFFILFCFFLKNAPIVSLLP